VRVLRAVRAAGDSGSTKKRLYDSDSWGGNGPSLRRGERWISEKIKKKGQIKRMKKKKDLQWAKMQKVGSGMGSSRFPHLALCPATKSALFHSAPSIEARGGFREGRLKELTLVFQ
jgi:hypothetical protein